MTTTVLTIAGSDPSGNAGLQVDLRVFAEAGLRGTAVVTAVTVQTAAAVEATNPVDPSLVAAQLRAALTEGVIAGKTGMLGCPEVVAELWPAGVPLVVDPVIRSTSGTVLGGGYEALLPRATIVTPNLPEARALTGLDDAPPEALARALVDDLGAGAALVTGGHGDDPDVVRDVLYDGAAVHVFGNPRLPGATATRGTGCRLSAALVVGLAAGRPLPEGCAGAIELVHRSLR